MASRKTSSVIALEFGPSTVRFVEMLPAADGLPYVLATGIAPLEAGTDAETHAASLRALLSRTSAFNGGIIAASVPLRHGFLRVLQIPRDDDPRETSEMLRWDMAQYLARPLDWYALDFQARESAVSPKIPEGAEDAQGAEPEESRCFLAAAYRLSEVEILRKALALAGRGTLSALEIDALSLVRVFAVNYPECLPERTLLIKADTQATSFFRTLHGEYHGGTVQYDSPDAPDFQALDAQERAENLRHRSRMISLGLGEALGDWGEPERIFLCGDLAGDVDFRELLKSGLPVPLALLNPFRKISGPNPGAYPDAYPGAPFAATVGVGLRAVALSLQGASGDSLDLLRNLPATEAASFESSNPPVRRAREKDPRVARRLWIALGLLILVIAGALLFRNFERIRPLLPAWESAERTSPATPVADDSVKRGLEQEASTLIADQQAATLAWLRELEAPLFARSGEAGITLLRTVFTTPEAFVIKGIAKNMSALSRFQETLVLVPGLELHRSDSRAVRPQNPEENLEFLFSGTLNSPTPEPAETAALRVLPKMQSERELGRFLDTAARSGIDFINLEMPPPTVAGALAAHPYRLTVLCDKIQGCDLPALRVLLENESRRDSPLGIQRITLDHTPGSQMIFLDIMAFSR